MGVGAAVAVGPLVGGVVVEELGWEWIFFVNVPIGAAAVGLTLARVAESREPGRGRLDWPGVATLASGLFLRVFGLLRGNAAWRAGSGAGRAVRRASPAASTARRVRRASVSNWVTWGYAMSPWA